VGYVVASSCDYFAPVSYPEMLELGLRIERLGSKSVSWELGVFSVADKTTRAIGRFTHAFVDQRSGKSAAIPPNIREALEALL
jgi:acyl-CoA thioester hydrolase